MGLSNSLINRFVKITQDDLSKKKESLVYGIVKKDGDKIFVQIDGSEILTPMPSVTTAKDGDRVKVEIRDHMAVIAGNMTSPSAMYADLLNTDQKVESVVAEVGAFEILIADKASVGELEAHKAYVTELLAGKITVDQLEAELAVIDNLISKKVSTDIFEAKTAEIDALLADKATIEQLGAAEAAIGQLNANKADISDLDAINAEIKNLDTEKADIDELNAAKADIKNLTSDVAEIDTLIFGSASGNSIQTSFANAVIAMLGNAQIKSAMIESLSASKITAGDIYTNNVRVLSEDGSLIISDETMQIKDSNRVRVQIGKDASNDYSINIWDASGNLMFSQGGITENAIKESIIRNDMVAANANISASKLDIDSLFEEINGSTKTIKATKVYFDDKAQTLDILFTKFITQHNAVRDIVSSQGTQIGIMQGQIDSKIWKSDIDGAIDEFEGTITTLSDQFSEFTQELDEISILVGQHTTQIANKADGSEVEAVESKVTNLTADLSGFKTTVSNTYVNKTDAEATYGKKSEIKQLSDNITSTVEDIGKRVSTVEQTADGFTARIDTVETNADDALFQAGLANTYAQAANTNAETANTRAKDAAKTATNYMNFSDAGLVIGDMTASSLGNNVLIDSNSVDIRNGSKTLASYQADAIYLGMDNPNAVIDLCSGVAQMKNINDDPLIEWYRFAIEALNQINLNSRAITASTAYEDEFGNMSDCILSMQSHVPWLGDYSTQAYVALSSRYFERSSKTERETILTMDTVTDDRSNVSLSVDANEVARFRRKEARIGNSDRSVDVKLYGSTVRYACNASSGGTVKPYYESGDYFVANIWTAGYMSSSRKRIYFTIPLSKPVLGNPSVILNSSNGFTIRQNNDYKYGSTASSPVHPTRITATLVGECNICDEYGEYEGNPHGETYPEDHYIVQGNHIIVEAYFSDNSDTVVTDNNDTVGIHWEGAVYFE